MTGDRRTGVDATGKGGKPWRVLGGMVAVVLASMGTSTCGLPPSSVDTCIDASDCIPNSGSICWEGICTCPDELPDFCFGVCRPDNECMMDGGGAGGGGGTGASGQGGLCKVAADCPQPGDPRCGAATCENGMCGLELKPLSKLASQIAGDCKQLLCDGDGNLTAISDASDTYNDGAQCTMDVCQAEQAKNPPYSNSLMCPETGEGVCYNSACVACIADKVSCGGNLVCDGVRCVPMACRNDQWDPGIGETAKNCGGPCAPCDPGQPCNVNKDCLSGVCMGSVCQPPTCLDGVQNDNETGADCGGPPSCPRCPTGEGCKVGTDCLSKVCWAGLCEPPRCDDGIQNGDETDWDCGGACAPCP
jgi:hypothetical protein